MFLLSLMFQILWPAEIGNLSLERPFISISQLGKSIIQIAREGSIILLKSNLANSHFFVSILSETLNSQNPINNRYTEPSPRLTFFIFYNLLNLDACYDVEENISFYFRFIATLFLFFILNIFS